MSSCAVSSTPRPRADLADQDEQGQRWYHRTLPLAGLAMAMVVARNAIF